MTDNNRITIEYCVALISELPGFLGLSYNPTALIRVVNCLYNLGLEKSIGALVSYCSIARQDMRIHKPENALLAARVLFVPKDSKKILPRLVLGQADIEEPGNHEVIPLYPLYIYRDLPLLLVGGYRIGGEAQPPLEYITWCEHNCVMRFSPLIPDDNPLMAVDEFLESNSWKDLKPDRWHYWMLRTQALRAVSAVYPVSEKQTSDILSSAGNDEIWQRHKLKFESLNVTWSRERDEYVIKNESKHGENNQVSQKGK